MVRRKPIRMRVEGMTERSVDHGGPQEQTIDLRRGDSRPSCGYGPGKQIRI